MRGLSEQRLKTAIRSIFQAVGFDVRRYGGSLGGLRCRILASGWIGVVLDVGANIGQYARYIRRCGYHGRIVSFEPLPDPYALLTRAAANDPRWDHHNVAVGADDGRLRIHVSENLVSSSPLRMLKRHKEAAPRSRYTGMIMAEVRRLDSLKEQIAAADDRMWMKVDVQGFEAQVLMGADQVLEQVDGIEVELSLVPLYEGQELFYEVSQRLYDKGFICVFLDPDFIDPKSGHILQVDGLFLRRSISD